MQADIISEDKNVGFDIVKLIKELYFNKYDVSVSTMYGIKNIIRLLRNIRENHDADKVTIIIYDDIQSNAGVADKLYAAKLMINTDKFRFKYRNKFLAVITQTRYFKVVTEVDKLVGLQHRSGTELRYEFSGAVEDDNFFELLAPFIINQSMKNVY